MERRKPDRKPLRVVVQRHGIPERYWIPAETGAEYRMTQCLQPLAPLRKDIHIISGLDNAAASLPGPATAITNP